MKLFPSKISNHRTEIGYLFQTVDTKNLLTYSERDDLAIWNISV